MTESAQDFIGKLSLSSLSGNKVILDKETLVKYRFKKISDKIDFSYNRTVQHMISYFMKDKKFVERANVRSAVYYPLFNLPIKMFFSALFKSSSL